MALKQLPEFRLVAGDELKQRLGAPPAFALFRCKGNKENVKTLLFQKKQKKRDCLRDKIVLFDPYRWQGAVLRPWERRSTPARHSSRSAHSAIIFVKKLEQKKLADDLAIFVDCTFETGVGVAAGEPSLTG